MYRDVLAEAAQARGWSVVEYETTTVLDDIGPRLDEIGKALGPPWQKDHRLAAAAALIAAGGI
jgi:hypothetical protein